MASEVADLWVRLRLLASDFSKGLEEAGAEAEGFGDRVTKSLTKATAVIGIGVVGMAGVAVKMAGDWQQSMIKLTTSAGEAGSAINGKLTGEISHVSDALLKMAVQTGTSTKELASGMYFVESAGYHGADALNVMRIAAEGAKAEGADLSTVADALTTVLHDMGMSADQSVPAMNMMIRAVGDGKMTMQDFSSALAAVLPQAHAAGLQFPDVAAALATMTVAGNSAQHSAEMLGHTIGSLQTPNAQAVKWMSQMGLSATDLKENLGSRGLLGTITLVDQAILSHMGKDGEVLQSAFNKSKSAAEDLKVMIGQMPPELQRWSEAVMNGTMTSKEYIKATNDIPANLKAQASEFLTLYKNASGFNTALRQGTPDVDTFAGMLKKVLGDSVDTNTALQIGGQNLAYYAQSANDVAAAGRQAGNDIETWSTITQGFNFRISQMRAFIETTAIRVGTVMLPKLMELFDLISSKGSPILHAFETDVRNALHSPAMEEAESFFKAMWRDAVQIIGELRTSMVNLWYAIRPVTIEIVGGFLVGMRAVGDIIKNVVGPAVVGLTKFFRDHSGMIMFLANVALGALIAKLIYTKTLLAIDMFKKFVDGISSAITWYSKFAQSVGSGAVFDTIRLKSMYAADSVRNFGKEEETAGVAAGEAAGLKGFGAFVSKLVSGIPIISGAALAITSLGMWTSNLASSARDATAEMNTLTNQLLDAAGGSQVAAGKLADLASVAIKAGDLGKSMIKPIDQALAQMVQSGHIDQANAGLAAIDAKVKAGGGDVAKFNGMLTNFNDAISTFNTQQREAATATDNSNTALGQITPTLDGAATATSDAANATDALANATANAFQQQQDMSAGLSADRAMDDFTRSVKTLTQSFKDNGSAIAGNTDQAMNNRDAIRNSVQAALDIYNANVQVNGVTAENTQKLRDQIKELVNQSSQSDATRKAVQAYVDTLVNIPSVVKTTVRVDTSAAQAQLNVLMGKFADLGGNAASAPVGGSSRVGSYAVGGFVTGPRGAPQLAVVHGGEYVVSLEEQESINAGGATSGNALSGARGGGNVSVHIHVAGSVIAERDLRDLVQTQMLQLGARYSTSYTAYKR